MIEAYLIGAHRPLIESRWREKNAAAAALLGQPPLRQLRPEALGARTRLDLMWDGLSLGIQGPAGDGGWRAFAPIEDADTAAPGIREMLATFLGSRPPLSGAQLRFRCNPEGLRGLWIDASRAAVAELLDEGRWLDDLLGRGWIIEIGQRGLAVERGGYGLGLGPAPALPWLASFDRRGGQLGLLSHVSSFSQPGPAVNRDIIRAGMDLLDEAGVSQAPWLEWGAGYGNLSAACHSRLGPRGWAAENHPVQARLLAENARRFFPGVITANRSAEAGWPGAAFLAPSETLWIIDPPRSGFGRLLAGLAPSPDRPRRVLAFHCHAAGLESDAGALGRAGYELRLWSSVDAFPASPHHEVVSLWERTGIG